MADEKFMTVDIVSDFKIGDRTWTPQQRIIPEAVGKQLIAAKVAFEIKPGTTPEQIAAGEAKAVAAIEKQATAPSRS